MTHKKTKDKIFFTSGQNSIRCFYQIDNEKPMKWKKEINGKPAEYSQSDPSGGYTLVCVNESGAINKKIYFSRDNEWKKTEYLSSEGVLSAALMSLYADGALTIVLQYPGKPSITLSPYYDRSNAQGEIIAKAITSRGEMYFAMPVAEKIKPEENTAMKSVNRKGFFFDPSLMYGEFTTLNIKKGYRREEKDDAPRAEATAAPFVEETTPTEEEPKGAFATHEEPDSSDMLELECENAPSDKFGAAVPDDEIKISDKEKYVYFGTKNKKGERSGSGITLTAKGSVLYSGSYSDGKRSGFGAQYYKNGKLAYVGKWSEDKKNGFGVSVLGDGSLTLGEFLDDKKKGVSARFDSNGGLLSVTSTVEGVENTISLDGGKTKGNMFISRTSDGSPYGSVTVLDKGGNIIYNGEMLGGEYSGRGKLFDKNGSLKYSGEFQNGLKNGNGILYLDDSSTISGEFHNDEVVGSAVHRGRDGRVLYNGGFKSGEYNGKGTLYNNDGSYYSAEFKSGKPVGLISLYSKNAELIYRGELKNDSYAGNGTLYSNGDKVYEGAFADGQKSGIGREYADSLCVYMGDHENDERNGFGISYINNKIEYSGFWKNGRFNGAGVLHSADDKLTYAGSFSDGQMNGRINVIDGEKLLRECLYENGECVYMREYDDEGAVIYDGGASQGLREGMGCSYTEFGEKIFEGIFKFGEPYKAMKVIPKALSELEPFEKLKDTPYNNYIKPPRFVSEQFLGNGIYSGALKNNEPHGKGTMLYTDHRYTGSFKNGKPNGSGILYFGDGKERKGSFLPRADKDCELIQFSDASYYLKSGGEEN